MISPDKISVIMELHHEGKSNKELSRTFNVSKNTIKKIIKKQGKIEAKERKDKIQIPDDLIREEFVNCNGWLQRVYEKLTERGIIIGYSTLTQKARKLGLGKVIEKRHAKVPDTAGTEMQHDTSPYKVLIGDMEQKIIGSLLYYRYSKMRYLKFYKTFNRFDMKCFFYEALKYLGYSAPVCIIDNTNLARLHGTGENATIVSEMESFSRNFGFKFVCHAKGHPDRKAGEERSFWYVETNFFPGRKFKDLDDLNNQAKTWATEIIAIRPHTKAKIIPQEMFNYEKSYLTKIADYIEPPHLQFERLIDQYGYIVFNGNFYYVPETRTRTVLVIRYLEKIKIYQERNLLVEYALPSPDVKNRCYPEELVLSSRPRNFKTSMSNEETKLKEIDELVVKYLEFIKTKHETPVKRDRFVRSLYYLSKKITKELFLKVLKRGHEYHISKMEVLEQMVYQELKNGLYTAPQVEYDYDYKLRDNYQEGRFNEESNVKRFNELLENNIFEEKEQIK